MQREVGRFKARNNDQEFTITENVDVIPAGNFQNPHAEILGRFKEYRTTEGYVANELEEGKFEIVELDVVVQRVECENQ